MSAFRKVLALALMLAPLPALAGGGVSAPTGGATAANQNVTAAGTSASNAQAIQGVTGGVAVPISGTATVAAATTGGATPYHYLSAASNNSTLVSTGAHSLYMLTVINTTATLYYLRVYDQSAAPTCSSATGAVLTFPIPGSTSGAGTNPSIPTVGVAFANGLGFCITAGSADNDNTSAVTGITVSLAYK